MALDPTTALKQIRDLVAGIEGFQRVYCEANTDADALPDALAQWPCALIFLGNTTEYLLVAPRQRHTYEVEVWIFPGASSGQNAAQGLGLFMDVVDLFAGNVTLGGRVTYCLLERQEGPVSEFYGRDIPFTVRKVVLRVSEAANVTAAGGD